MRNKILFILLVLLLLPGLSLAAKVPAPDKGGKGFASVTLEEAKVLMEKGASVVACHSHTTDFMDGHPKGTIHITCLVPKDHKRVDLELNKINFDINQLPKDKSTTIIMYCASGT